MLNVKHSLTSEVMWKIELQMRLILVQNSVQHGINNHFTKTAVKHSDTDKHLQHDFAG